MRWIAMLLVPLAAFAQLGETASVVTNLDSNVESTKAWRRHYVMRSGAGEMIDASGALATYAKVKTMDAVLDDIDRVTTAAFAGMQSALDDLYALTNSLPTVGCSLKVALKPSTSRQNFWAYVAAQTTDGTNDTAWVWFSQALETPPKMCRRYWGEETTMIVDGEFPDGLESPVSTNGFSNCHRVVYARPAFAKGVLLVPDEYVGIGAPDRGIAFASAVVTVDSALTLTGEVTNRTYVVDGATTHEVITVDNGVITSVDQITEEE